MILFKEWCNGKEKASQTITHTCSSLKRLLLVKFEKNSPSILTCRVVKKKSGGFFEFLHCAVSESMKEMNHKKNLIHFDYSECG